MNKIVSLCKRRGFIFPGSEIYGGINGFWDYGPLGVELKNNLKKIWWRNMVYDREDVVGVDAAIIMNPKVWEVSGHTQAFTDPLVECKKCHHRFRADKIKTSHCPDCGGELTSPKKFNLLTEVYIGTVEDEKRKTYLRGEITQGVFVNFKNVVDSTRVKIPFGIAQIGKAFRNEITPGNFTYRSREFEQMELEYFIEPNEKEGERWFNYFLELRLNWYKKLGIKENNLRIREHAVDERAHYAKKAVDIEYQAPFGWSEFEGIHHRGDWDLSRHNIKYQDKITNNEYYPWVIEVSGGVDRAVLFFLIDSYYEENQRVILKLNYSLAPIKAAIFPLLKNKPELVDKAKKIYQNLKNNFMVIFDDRGNIGKRYLYQDEIGTPFCITVDFQTLKDNTVTIRDRDTTNQIRLNIDKIHDFLSNKIS